MNRQPHLRWTLALAAALCWPSPPAGAQPTDPSPGEASCLLLNGSHLVDDCTPQGGPIVREPLRGRFLIHLIEATPGLSRFEIINLSSLAGTSPGRVYRITGRGACTVDHVFAAARELTLEVTIDDGSTRTLCYLTNTTPTAARHWPLIDIDLVQTSATAGRTFQLHLTAAPVRDFWFSTPGDWTSALWNPPTNRIRNSDLLSFQTISRRPLADLAARLGLLPSDPDPGLDALGVTPGGETLFSLARDAFSDRHGWLQHGDLLADTGRLVRRNQDLYAAFSPMPAPSPPDVGLDAIQWLDTGEVYFSIREGLFSERLGRLLGRGDLLSDRGVVIRTHEALLARFHPPPIPRDFGLDVIHVWPGGEIWFSLEEGFVDDQLGPVGPGDLLSDRGEIIFRNLELVNPFAPLEELADFGLDALAVLTNAPPPPPVPPPDPTWHHTLLGDSLLTDDCACGRPPITVPLRGGFDLLQVAEDPLFSHYALRNIAFTATVPLGTTYKITGHGTYRIGGEVAVIQDMALELLIDDGTGPQRCLLTQEAAPSLRAWPMIAVHLDQTNGSPARFYRLDLATAPVRELWFSTTHGFHPAFAPPEHRYIQPGDLVSSTGRLVKRNQALTARFGFMPVVPDFGLDAVDLLPGGEIAFSLDEDAASGSLGLLHEGDVLSDRGRVLHGYTELIGAFTPEPPPADQGLDALHAARDNAKEILFSVERDFFSEGLGRRIGRGDLLSSRGQVIQTNGQLVARFQPADPTQDYGLDALWVWPTGEIWFSVEQGFHGPHFEFYAPGDLLSNQGYIVYRSLDLVAAFAPLEDLGDFGLDALVLISDFGPAGPGARFTGIRPLPGAGGLLLDWEGTGRAFQLQHAARVTGPYLPRGDIQTDAFFHDTLPESSPAFYRVQQW